MSVSSSSLSLTAILALAALLATVSAQQTNELQAPIAANTSTTCEIVTQKPTPQLYKYHVDSCIVAQMSGYFSIDSGKKFVEIKNAVVNTSVSTCNTNKTTPLLAIDFDCGKLLLSIDRSNNSRIFVKSIVATLNVPGFNTGSNLTEHFATTQSGHYYKCNTEQEIGLGNNNSLVVSNFAYEAYRNTSGTDFYQIAEDCPLDSQPVSHLVRIGFGLCLVALVVIVLIAYFVGRRRWAERSSYESV